MKRLRPVIALLIVSSMVLASGCTLSPSGSSRRHRDHDDDDEETRRTSRRTEETEETTEDTTETSEPETAATTDKEPDQTTAVDLTEGTTTLQTPSPDDGTEPGEGAPIYDGMECNQTFGTYYVTNGWVNVPAQSAPPDTYTYCAAGNENSTTPPNNIVVRHGDNFYSPEEHEDFCTAILQQVTVQAAEFGGTAYLDSYGPINGCMVYKFVLDCQPYTEQWYFCGDHEFVMVGMQIFDEDEAETDHTRDVAEDILYSFEWAD